MHKWILLSIVIFAGILRFINIGVNPPSLTWDEVALGYNAYAIGVDGKDEFGKFLPITYLESFGDYKPPMYTYLSVVPVKLFGLNEFSTRFASAFFGVLTVLLAYFVTKEIFYEKSQKEEGKRKLEAISLITAFILCISPWHTLLSRAAFEANIATFFIVCGVLCFLLALRKYPYLLIVSLLSFVFSMYTFNTARIVSPLLVIGFFLVKRKQLWQIKKSFILACVIAGIVVLPLLIFLRTPQAQLRFKEVNIFTDSSVVERANQEIANDNNALWSKIIHNRRLAFSVEYLKHYFDNLSPSFLFVKGDGNIKFSTQDVGQMFLWEAPFLIYGMLLVFRKRRGNWWIIPYWLIVGIIPAATARETPHALRIEAILPTLQIFTSVGFVTFLIWLFKASINNKVKKVVAAFIGIIILITFVYYIHGYYTYYPKEFSSDWQYGYKQAVEYAKANEDTYDKVFLSDALGRPYAYALFYKQYDPKLFRGNADVKRDVFGFVHVDAFGKYVFTKHMINEKNPEKVLYIDRPEEVSPGATILKKFTLLNGETVLVAYTK